MEKTENQLLDLKKISKVYQEAIAMNLLDHQDANRMLEKGIKEPLLRAEKIKECLSQIPNLLKSIHELSDLVDSNKQKTTEAVSTLTMYTQQQEMNEFRDHIDTIAKQLLSNAIFLCSKVPNAQT